MEIDTRALYIGLCIIALLVLGINFGIWAFYRRSGAGRSGNKLQGTERRVRKPWADEDESLEELSKRVQHLQEQKPDSPTLPSIEPGKKE